MLDPKRQNGWLKIPLLVLEENAGSNRSTFKDYPHCYILVGNASENNIDPERRMFSAGICLIYIWMSHSNM